MFDQAFDALKPTNGAAPEKHGARPAAQAKTRSTQPARQPTELTAPSDDEMLGLTDDAELAIESEPAVPEPPRAADRPRDRGVGHELSLEDNLTDDDGRIAELVQETRQLKDDIAKRDAAAKTLQHRADSLAAAAKKFERELAAAREEAKGGSKAEVARLQAELDKARQEVAELTGEKDLVRDEREELQRQVEQAQAAAKQNEQRAIKAYQKMKGDEKLREKTRKALQIALALLDNVSLDVDAESEKESA